MLEKLATHEVESVTTLFSLADKCAMAAEGHAWHSAPQDGANQARGSGTTIQGGGKKKNKNRDRPRPQVGATVAVAAAGGQKPRAKHPRTQGSCLSTPTLNTAPPTVVRSRSSRGTSRSDGSRPPRRVALLLLAGGRLRRRSPEATLPLEEEAGVPVPSSGAEGCLPHR